MSAIWSDINAQVGQDGAPFIVTDLQAIEKAIYNILTCPIGSRGWRPTFGSMIPYLLWENVTKKTTSSIRASVIDAIKKWETRVTVAGCNVVPTSDGIGYYVEVIYSVNLTGTVGSVTYTFLR